MLEELSITDLNNVHNSNCINNKGQWSSFNDKYRLSHYRESYCSDVDSLPPLCTKVIDNYQVDSNNSSMINNNNNNNDLINLTRNNSKQMKNMNDKNSNVIDSNNDDGDNADNDETLMNWLLKQFKENGLDNNSNDNLKDDDFDRSDGYNDLHRSIDKTSILNNCHIDDSSSSISSYQATIANSNKLILQNDYISSNTNEKFNHTSSREQFVNKQHHFPRMYPPLRDSSVESRKLYNGYKSTSSTITTTTPTTITTTESTSSSMLKEMNHTTHQCKLINDLFHQISKKLTCLHEFDEQVIHQLQNASRIINDLQKSSIKYSESSLLNPVLYNQLNHHIYRPKMFTPDLSLRKKSGTKHFPKKNANNFNERSTIDKRQLDYRSSVEKDDWKSPSLNGVFTSTIERRSTQRKFTESPWGPVTIKQTNNLSNDFNQRPKITSQNNHYVNNNIINSNHHMIENDNYSKGLKPLKSLFSNSNLDKSNESTQKVSNLSNERSISQLTLPLYSTSQNTKSHTSSLNTSGELNTSENTSNKFITTKGFQSLFKLPFKRKASTPGPNNPVVGHPLKFQGRSASLAQLHPFNDKTSPLMSISNDQLNESSNKSNVPYIKPLLLKDLSKF
ncbi:hypothetical protein MN116_001017 [Schistosoma mekongi]|uniref:Uncharacterized protein n=1 Tax=Schistosoma mekongi TaxID=38744 RepID=A0AAE1ZKW4_SCHME|nr:hypothetical protein MN116_001017 [Schistosoma mekongi]